MKTITEKEAIKKFGKKRYNQVWTTGEDPDVKSVDWRAAVSDVIQEIDEQLKVHGLEVVLIKTDDDNYVWFVGKL